MTMRILSVVCLTAMLATQAANAAAPIGAPMAGQPHASPIRAATTFDPALRCMDELLTRSPVGSGLYLIPQNLEDPGGKMGVTRDMIIAAASRMSERSHFFTILVGTAKAPEGVVFVTQGSVTALDQQVESRTKGGGLAIGQAIGANTSRRDSASNLTISLFLTDAKGQMLSGTFHSEQITLRTRADARYLGGSIGTVGGSLNFEASVEDGPQAATRALIDLAMIEAVGELAQVPYATCLAKLTVDPANNNALLADYNRMKPAERIAAITDEIVRRGLAPPSPSPVQLREGIAAFERSQGMPPIGAVNFEVYQALKLGSIATAQSDRPGGRGPAVKVSPHGAGFEFPQGAPYPSVGVDNKLAFDITVAEPAYVACYYTDAARKVVRVFPNAGRPAYRLMPGETLRIPGDQDGFTIKPDTGGKGEWFTCMAAREQFLGRIADSVPDYAMNPLPFPSASALIDAAKKAAPDLSVDTLSYYVKP